jgi:hypothetical protein
MWQVLLMKIQNISKESRNSNKVFFLSKTMGYVDNLERVMTDDWCDYR